MASVLQRMDSTFDGRSHLQANWHGLEEGLGWAVNECHVNQDIRECKELEAQAQLFPTFIETASITNFISVSEVLKTRFRVLVDSWQNETGMLSSVAKKTAHPAYQEIIELGIPAIPLILEELIQRPNHWSVALRSITGENPVSPDDAGYIQRVTNAWIRWGTEQGYIGELCTWNPVKNLDSLTLGATNTK